MAMTVVADIVEAVIFYLDKNAFGGIFLIEAILSALLGWYFYKFIGGLDANKMTALGYVSISFGIISLLLAQIMIKIKKSIG